MIPQKQVFVILKKLGFANQRQNLLGIQSLKELQTWARGVYNHRQVARSRQLGSVAQWKSTTLIK